MEKHQLSTSGVDVILVFTVKHSCPISTETKRGAKDTSKGDAALRQAKRVLQISRRRRTVTVKVEESLRSQAFLKKLGSPSCPRF
ncbi:hypothetical protein NQZ68_025988 [Dissostichus eleginoides]|nr:hypothetical protein NQZ68_025988 [Dissostichus eleginoides]